LYVSPSNYKTPTSYGSIGVQNISGMQGPQLPVGPNAYYTTDQSARL